MAYEKHEMNVVLFSKKDDVFAETDDTITSPNDNEWDESEHTYSQSDKAEDTFEWDW